MQEELNNRIDNRIDRVKTYLGEANLERLAEAVRGRDGTSLQSAIDRKVDNLIGNYVKKLTTKQFDALLNDGGSRFEPNDLLKAIGISLDSDTKIYPETCSGSGRTHSARRPIRRG